MAQIVDVMPVFKPYIDRMAARDVAKDPNFHYRWATLRPGRVEFLRELGYEVVRVKDTTTGEMVPKTVGNSLLMRCPKEQYEQRELYRQHVAAQRRGAPRQKVKDTGEALGLEVTDRTREYRAPMSSALQEGPTKEEQQEGVVTRQQVEQVFNPHLQNKE